MLKNLFIPPPNPGAFRTWQGMVATCGGVGFSRVAPGTMGSLVALILLLALGGIPLWAVALVSLVGGVAADRYARDTGRTDPPEVVIDEVAGYWLAQWGLSPTLALGTFFLFRVLDILKPFPIRRFERLPGGWGILADDLVGGLLVNIIVRAVNYLLFDGGLARFYGFFGS